MMSGESPTASTSAPEQPEPGATGWISRAARHLREPPPSYDEVTNPNAPPPSYDSLFGRLRHADSPGGFANTVYGAWKSCCSSMGVLVGLGVTAALPLAMVVLGGMNVDTCPAEPYIPIYLIVGGVVSFFSTILNIGFKVSQSKRGVEKPEGTPIWLDFLLTLFQLSWFIAGTVWVYRVAMPNMDRDKHYIPRFTTTTPPLNLNSTSETSPLASNLTPNFIRDGLFEYGLREYIRNPNYCDKRLYIFAFCVVTIGWSVLWLVIMVGCCLCYCFCCFVIFSKTETVERRAWDDEAAEAGVISEKEREAYRRQSAANNDTSYQNNDLVVEEGEEIGSAGLIPPPYSSPDNQQHQGPKASGSSEGVVAIENDSEKDSEDGVSSVETGKRSNRDGVPIAATEENRPVPISPNREGIVRQDAMDVDPL